jgi:asparagine synthase (glutamine-hydrolysing)
MPPDFSEADSRPMEVAAEELRHLLQQAVQTRIGAESEPAVWLSGGWDSTAVFAAGESVLERDNKGVHLRPISVSYPVNDPGREDELIAMVAKRWNRDVDWIDIRNVQLFDNVADRAAAREDAPVHLFESWSNALADRTAETGCRIVFSGRGGDELFAVGDVYLSDMLRTGHWRALLSEWRARGRPKASSFLRRTVHPLVPLGFRQAVAALKGRQAGPHYLERSIAPWIRQDFATRTGLGDRQRYSPPGRNAGLAGNELAWFVTNPYFSCRHSHILHLSMQTGISPRWPLYDRRIVEFVARRPVSDRVAGLETKRILRASMAGLLPAEVLAPRRARTGVTSGFLVNGVRDFGGPHFKAAFRNPLLAELGIVDPVVLRSACDAFAASPSPKRAASLFHTFSVELWVRARMGVPRLAGMDVSASALAV